MSQKRDSGSIYEILPDLLVAVNKPFHNHNKFISSNSENKEQAHSYSLQLPTIRNVRDEHMIRRNTSCFSNLSAPVKSCNNHNQQHEAQINLLSGRPKHTVNYQQYQHTTKDLNNSIISNDTTKGESWNSLMKQIYTNDHIHTGQPNSLSQQQARHILQRHVKSEQLYGPDAINAVSGYGVSSTKPKIWNSPESNDKALPKYSKCGVQKGSLMHTKRSKSKNRTLLNQEVKPKWQDPIGTILDTRSERKPRSRSLRNQRKKSQNPSFSRPRLTMSYAHRQLNAGTKKTLVATSDKNRNRVDNCQLQDNSKCQPSSDLQSFRKDAQSVVAAHKQLSYQTQHMNNSGDYLAPIAGISNCGEFCISSGDRCNYNEQKQGNYHGKRGTMKIPKRFLGLAKGTRKSKSRGHKPSRYRPSTPNL